MEIDIQLLPIRPDPASLSNRSVVVLDILRATSVIVHALSHGAKEFIPVLSVEEAFDTKKKFPPGTTFLGGEKDTQPIEGFDLGNSPEGVSFRKDQGQENHPSDNQWNPGLSSHRACQGSDGWQFLQHRGHSQALCRIGPRPLDLPFRRRGPFFDRGHGLRRDDHRPDC